MSRPAASLTESYESRRAASSRSDEVNATYIELSYFQVCLAALLIVINGVISVLLRLKLERRLFLAAVCTVVQLLFIGLVLEWVFRVNRWYVVLGLLMTMTLI